MKMDPCDTVKLGAGLVTRRDTEMYSVTRCAGGRGEIGREEKWRGVGDEREAIEAKRELNVEE